jgi:hypothetical protein
MVSSSSSKKSEKSIKSSEIFGDIILTWKNGAFDNAVLESEPNLPYKINGENVINVELISNNHLAVFKTKTAFHFRYKNNKRITDRKEWKDYYYDSFSMSFYRKDSRGYWYDTEGVKLSSTIILKDDILISLIGKVSKKNQIFRNQKPYTSPNSELIQIGKIVLDYNLDPVTYYNEKITGLGKNVVTFENGSVYQEIYLGIKNKAFINEKTKTPIIIKGNEIVSYNEIIELGPHCFYVFKDKEREYYLNSKNTEPLEVQDSPYTIDPKSYIHIGQEDIIKVNSISNNFYYNLTKKEIFQIPELGSSEIIKVSKSNVAYNKCELFNVSTSKKSIVIRSDNQVQYIPASNAIEIEKIMNVPGFENVLALVTIHGKQQLFSLQTEELILLENDAIVRVDGHSKNKLLNAITANGQRTTLDLRKGHNDLNMATSDGSLITQTESEPYSIGSKILQNVKVQTLGGVQKRVIDLNSESLSIFKLPESMMTYTGGEEKSVFAGIEILSIDYEKIIEIEDRKFITAHFRSYDDELHTVILDQLSGRPIRLDGLGHKLELVTGFALNKDGKNYNIGPHHMVSAITLKEDLKSDELLFSTKIMSSWIPFSDGYLPILKEVVEGTESGQWNYHLFELRTLSNEKEFIAVEQTYPHRILVKNKGERQEPLVVKSKEKVLKSPDEISIISKLFYNNSGVLSEVY